MVVSLTAAASVVLGDCPRSLGAEQAADASGRSRRDRQGPRCAGPERVRRRSSASGVHGQTRADVAEISEQASTLHAAARVGGTDASPETAENRPVRRGRPSPKDCQPVVHQLSFRTVASSSSETARGLRIVDKNGRLREYISGLPIDFSQTCTATARCRFRTRTSPATRVIYFLYRVPPKEAGDIGTAKRIFRCTIPRSKWSARGRLSATTSA